MNTSELRGMLVLIAGMLTLRPIRLGQGSNSRLVSPERPKGSGWHQRHGGRHDGYLSCVPAVAGVGGRNGRHVASEAHYPHPDATGTMVCSPLTR